MSEQNAGQVIESTLTKTRRRSDAPDFGDTARRVWMPETAAVATSDACDPIRYPELSGQIQTFTRHGSSSR